MARTVVSVSTVGADADATICLGETPKPLIVARASCPCKWHGQSCPCYAWTRLSKPRSAGARRPSR
ncbi:MAG: hypothetical protein NZ874_05870 [Fimbriimonadales bacterium]|nr:hypothetical protein [Fimbriimonadales bacterium]